MERPKESGETAKWWREENQKAMAWEKRYGWIITLVVNFIICGGLIAVTILSAMGKFN